MTTVDNLIQEILETLKSKDSSKDHIIEFLKTLGIQLASIDRDQSISFLLMTKKEVQGL